MPFVLNPLDIGVCPMLPPTKDQIARYAIYRSPLQVQLFNVVAISEKNKPLFVQQADISFNKAQELVTQLHDEMGIKDDE